MERRRFAKLTAAAVLGVRVADEVSARPLLLEDARTNEWDRSPEFDATPWPAAPVTDELLADAAGYYVPREFAAEFRRYEHEILYGTGRAEPRGFLTSRVRHA